MSVCVILLLLIIRLFSFVFFFFNDTATTEIYTLSLHDALPICWFFRKPRRNLLPHAPAVIRARIGHGQRIDRKSTRLNSSHLVISYAVFCLKKKKKNKTNHTESASDTVRASHVGRESSESYDIL